MQKPTINYPCFWEYKIIGPEQASLEQAAAEVIGERDYLITSLKKSSRGRYSSLNLRVKVLDESDRNSIFSAFSCHDKIKIVF